MMYEQRDVWAEVLSVDWPLRGLRAAGGTLASPSRVGLKQPSAILDQCAPIVGRALPIDVRVVIELLGPEGGVWTLDRTAQGPRVTRSDAPWCDSRLRCQTEHFLSLIQPDSDAMALLASGAVEVEGDVGLLLRLRAAWNEGEAAPVG